MTFIRQWGCIRISRGFGSGRWGGAVGGGQHHAEDLDEDDVVIEAFKKLSERRRDVVLVIAPRRPEEVRCGGGKVAAGGGGVCAPVANDGSRGGVRLLDSIGELAAVFERATVVFMGGTLVARGGAQYSGAGLFWQTGDRGSAYGKFCGDRA